MSLVRFQLSPVQLSTIRDRLTGRRVVVNSKGKVERMKTRHNKAPTFLTVEGTIMFVVDTANNNFGFKS